jgi:cellulose synthase/poly-beta-1,6-N-acetylglucosamine synthase-like glycosyltransferase
LKETAYEIVFVVSAGAIAYVYAGYPLILKLLAQLFYRERAERKGISPKVTLIISAYNEAAVIGQKLDNTFCLNYPRELLEIVVVSDCSNDGTDEIVQKYATHGVQLVRLPERLGKSAGLNVGVSRASGEVFLFSDANAIYEPDAVRKLVRHFCDPRVGYVVGNARYSEKASQAASAKSEGLYWRLETWLKEQESNFGSVVGGDGAIYAIRGTLFTHLRPTDINDFLNPLQIIASGYRGVYEPSAVCFEEAGDRFDKEFRRKVRIVSRSLNAVFRAPRVLLPWTQPRHWFALISHKLLRWFAPLFLVALLVSTVCLWHIVFYRLVLYLQMAFYVFSAAGWWLEKRKTIPKILYLSYYFVLINLAALFGIIKFLTGSLSPTWQTIRQEGSPRTDSNVRLAGKEL